MNKKIIITAKDLTKTFISGDKETQVLKGIDLDVYEGEFVAIMGRSGAGKSTCMYQLSLLDEPTSGTIKIYNKNVSALSESERTNFRLYNFGYIFQDYSLIPELSALENIMLPLMMQGKSKKNAQALSLNALIQVNLANRSDNLPSELSGGEQQRVAIARAICHNPKIIFADEPTANLDNSSSQIVMQIFKDLNEKNGLTIIMVTHEEVYGKMCNRIIKLDDGRLV